MARRRAGEGVAPPPLRRHLAGCRRALGQWRALVGAAPRSPTVEPLLDAVERDLDALNHHAERLEALEAAGPRGPALEPLLDDMERELDALDRKAEQLEALVREALGRQAGRE